MDERQYSAIMGYARYYGAFGRILSPHEIVTY